MAARRCMNAACGAAAPPDGVWRKGWGIRSGGFANLCDKCGMAYEQLVFCELFHQKESGWRECIFCGKRLHCGCIASKPLLDLLDCGGVQCSTCMRNAETSFMRSEAIEFMHHPYQMALSLSARCPKEEIATDFGASLAGITSELGSTSTDRRVDGNLIAKGKIVQLIRNTEINEHYNMFLAKRGNYSLNGPFVHTNGNQVTHTGSTNFINREQGPLLPSQISLRDDSKVAPRDGTICESVVQSCMNMNSGNSNTGQMMEAISPSGMPQMTLPMHSLANHQAQRSHNLLPKTPKSGQPSASETSKEVISHLRVARPSGEGRGRHQLLPRYWPRITDQELQQISGDPNSTIVPLFEKVLSASDAGRIGRLVLPKACAEAYFPPISQPEGLPLTIHDVRGKDWHFQFRFWPNNNSRMYVLEGVTPCIQSLQLQAGDTVTFSRIDPEGKIVMGYRKATNSVPLQDSQISAIANGALGSETFFSAVNENLPIVNGYSGFLQSLKGSADPSFSSVSEHLNSTDVDSSWQKIDKHGGITFQPLLVTDKRRSRNIGLKSKRLHMDNEDALELKLTWEEFQDLLRPPPSVKPSILVIEDHEFEEYEEPPVFGKRTIFTARASGDQDQWTQCDECFKWRRLPVDVLLPSKWTCTDNIWDPQRSYCAASDELSSKELHTLLQQNSDMKRQKTSASSSQYPQDVESSGLDALAGAAVLGDAENLAIPSTATTTKHPRHRPGCTCIVCIQPPSGKGPKHNPLCTCNVCLTVKRRFKTLMMRKKQRQSEREEAEAAQKVTWNTNEDIESSSSIKIVQPLDYIRSLSENLDVSKAHLDLNNRPERDAVQQNVPLSGVSMVSLVHEANLSLETYLKQNGLTSLAGEQQVSSSSLTVPQTPGESKVRTPEESCLASAARDLEGGADEGSCDPDKAVNDAT